MNSVLAAAAVAGAPVVALDCETSGIHATARMVGLAIYVPGDLTAYYLPTYTEIDPASSLVPESEVLAIIAAVLSDPTRTMIAHNAAYELMIFRRLGIQARCRIFDTMLGYHRLNNTFPNIYVPEIGQLNYKLKTLTRAILGAHQDTFDGVTQGLPAQMVPAAAMADYACQDVFYTTQHYLQQLQHLHFEPGILNVLENIDFPLLPTVCEMLFGGIPIDPELARQNIAAAKQNFKQIELEISTLLGRPAQISKKGVLRNILVQDCGLAEAAWRSLSEKSLLRMRKDASGTRAALAQQFVTLIIERRKQADALSKFFNPILGRMNQTTRLLHPGGFNMMTETGRFAAQNPNVQAMPKRGRVRQMIVAGPDEEIVSIDFSNIEPRVLAQALTGFIQDQNAPIDALKAENRQHAKAVFCHLLKDRKFRRPYQEPTTLPFPTTSALAECFADKNGDPYVLVAQRMYGSATIDKATRNKAKGILLATMYGQSLPGYVARMDCPIDDAADMLNRLSDAVPEIGVPKYVQKANGNWVKAEPVFATYREHVESMIRLSGEVTGLFGRKRRFAGLYQLRHAQRATIVYEWRNRFYEWDVAPIQLWNYALHCYVYSVRDQKTGTVLATSTSSQSPYSVIHRKGLCYWPFRQLSYKFIRSVIIGGEIIKFQPLEDCQRQGFNAIIQMSAGDIFKQTMQRMGLVARSHGGRMFLSVHDELVFVIPKVGLHGFIAEAVASMEQQPAPWFTIPIKVEVKVGPNYDLKDVLAYSPPDPNAADPVEPPDMQ